MQEVMAAIGAFNILYVFHFMLLAGIIHNCNGFCVLVKNDGSRVLLHATHDGSPLKDASVLVAVNGVASSFTTNGTGAASFFAPLKFGANNLTISSAYGRISLDVYYLGDLSGLIFLLIGAASLLVIVKISDFASSNKKILVYFNEYDYAYGNATMPENRPAKARFKISSNSEPYEGFIAEKMLVEALARGTYKIGNAGTTKEVIENNGVFALNDMKRFKHHVNDGHIKIATLNEHQYRLANYAKYYDSKLGYVMLYVHATGSLEVIKFFGL